MSFRHRMERSAKRADSSIILALDLPSDEPDRILSRSLQILDIVHTYICAVKLNRQVVLPLGLFDGVQKIVRYAHDFDLPVIMDCKINDIGNTNRAIASYYYEAGFDAVIANPFVGWEEGLQPVFDVARQMDRGVIVLAYMSHRSAQEGYGQTVHSPEHGHLLPQYILFAEKALAWGADGVIVGATYPDKIREIYAVLKTKVPIYSPGIGAQGGDIEAAIEAGSRYLIIGRVIVQAENAEQVAKRIRETVRQCSNH